MAMKIPPRSGKNAEKPPTKHRMMTREAVRNSFATTTKETLARGVARNRGLVVPQGGGKRSADDLADSPVRGAALIHGLNREPRTLGGRPRRENPHERVADAVAGARRVGAGEPTHAALMSYIAGDPALVNQTHRMVRDANGHLRRGTLWGAQNMTAADLLAALNATLAELDRPLYGAAPEPEPGKRRRWFARRSDS